MAKLPEPAGRRLRPADRLAAHRDRHRPRRRLAARPVARRRSTRRSTTPSASARSATIYTSSTQYKVILEVQPQFQTDPTALSRIYVTGTNGAQVPLSTVAKFTNKVEPLTVNHQGQFPAVTLSFNLAPGTALGQAVERIQQMQRDLHDADHARGHLPGHGAGLPVVAVLDAAPGRGRDPRRLHRARHALRELHPSDHHPVGAALGRRRRAARADAVRLRPQRHRARSASSC